MHNDHIVIDVVAGGIFKGNLLINLRFELGKVDVVALKSVMHFLRDAEEIGAPLDDAPAGLDPSGVHQESHRREKVGNSTAVIGGTNIDDVQISQVSSLREDAVDGGSTNDRFVISDRDQFKSCHICALLGDDHRQLSVPPHCRFWLPFAVDPIGPNTRTYCIQFNELIAPVRAVRSYAD